jgi:hypothetical protein
LTGERGIDLSQTAGGLQKLNLTSKLLFGMAAAAVLRQQTEVDLTPVVLHKLTD